MSLQHVTLGQLIKPAKLYRAGSGIFPILSMTMHDGLVEQAKKFKKRVASSDTSQYKVVKSNQLVVGFPIDEGVLSFQYLFDEAIVSPAYDVWDLQNDEQVDSRYLERFLRSPHALNFYKSKLRGTTARRRTLPNDIFLSLIIPLPSLEEQQRITDILDRAEALRAKRRAALAQLDELTEAIFIDMFGDPVTNPKGWSRTKLGELIATGPQNGLYKPASDYGSGIPILRIDAFYDGHVTKLSTLKRVRISDEELNLYRLSPGDIIINRVNSMEYLGKSAIIPKLDEPIVFESNMMRFSVDQSKIEPQYLVQFLQTSFIKGQIINSAKHAVNQSSINQKDVKSFQVNVPPLPLQKELVRRVEAVKKLKTAHEASLTELDKLFASLQYRAFRGEL
ncbi:MAG: restriction endonuclease subunit S [Methanosarcina sp.]